MALLDLQGMKAPASSSTAKSHGSHGCGGHSGLSLLLC